MISKLFNFSKIIWRCRQCKINIEYLCDSTFLRTFAFPSLRLLLVDTFPFQIHCSTFYSKCIFHIPFQMNIKFSVGYRNSSTFYCHTDYHVTSLYSDTAFCGWVSVETFTELRLFSWFCCWFVLHENLKRCVCGCCRDNHARCQHCMID